MRCRLVRPSVEYLNSLECFKQAFSENCEDMHGSSGLDKCSDINIWLRKVNKQYDESLKSGIHRQLQYLYVADNNTVIGMINYRDLYTDFLKTYGGNIGYCIHPKYRKLGHCHNMLMELLSKIEYDIVLITCLEDNHASKNTIISDGGVFDKSVLEPSSNKDLLRYYIYNTGRLEQRTFISNADFTLTTTDGIKHSFVKNREYICYKITNNRYLFIDDSNKCVFISQFEFNKLFR